MYSQHLKSCLAKVHLRVSPSLWHILISEILIHPVICCIGAALNIDPRQFYTQLYGVILELNTCKCTLSCLSTYNADKDFVFMLVSIFLWLGSSNENVLLAVKCLDRMMRKRRQVGCLLVFVLISY